MVVGHTIQEQGANAACGGQVVRVDVGLSRGCGDGAPQVWMVLRASVAARCWCCCALPLVSRAAGVVARSRWCCALLVLLRAPAGVARCWCCCVLPLVLRAADGVARSRWCCALLVLLRAPAGVARCWCRCVFPLVLRAAGVVARSLWCCTLLVLLRLLPSRVPGDGALREWLVLCASVVARCWCCACPRPLGTFGLCGASDKNQASIKGSDMRMRPAWTIETCSGD
eukprot:30731-Chlamydomonas_euryale.AAC.1